MCKQIDKNTQLKIDALNELEGTDILIEGAYITEEGCHLVVNGNTYSGENTVSVINAVKQSQ